MVIRHWAVAAALTARLLWSAPAGAETICVKYGQCPLDLSAFECADVTRSSLVNRVCYDAEEEFMVVMLRDTYYPYCSIDAATVGAFMAAPSMGTFYNANIRSPRGGGYGRFDCRIHPMPRY